MAKKFILHGMEIRRGRLRGLVWGVATLCCSLLFSPIYAGAETNTCVQSPSSIISWWPGNGNASDIVDSNHGTLQNGATFAAQAFNFDGVDDYVDAGTSDVFNFKSGAGDFTIDAWIKLSSMPSFASGIVGKGTHGLGGIFSKPFSGWSFYIYRDGRLGFGGDGVWEFTSVANTITPGTWYHVAITRSGSTYKLYSNSVEVGSVEHGNLETSATSLKIGSSYGDAVFFIGNIDEVEIFNRALLASEIQAIFNAGSAGCRNNPPTASAGPNQAVECAGPSGASVILNGSASSDPDGDPLTYTWAWAGGSAEGATPTVTLPLGTTVVILTVNDGKVTATDTVNITVQDKTPPITTATGGSDNWYNANVISSFSATDSCSGVKEVHYTVNGTETVILGDSASLTLATDGTYNIAYYSIDNSGNVESPKSMTVKIDKTPPVLSLSTNPNTLWPPNHKMTDVLIGGNAIDATSGIASVAFTVVDEYGTVQPSISNFNSTIQLEAWREGTDMDGRHYTITAVAADAAGNKTKASTTVLVPHDQGKK